MCEMEEEHLWESKQLGAHSPYVLLNTLIYFNTCYFHLRSVDDHLHLSFSHIMKHWKKLNIPGAKLPGRSVYLRYYVPAPIGKSWFWTQRVSAINVLLLVIRLVLVVLLVFLSFLSQPTFPGLQPSRNNCAQNTLQNCTASRFNIDALVR